MTSILSRYRMGAAFRMLLAAFALTTAAFTAAPAQGVTARAIDIQDGGSEMIPVTTPQGTLHVWTKRVGNHPKIKVLLLAGGPGASHEYLECFESFFPKEDIEFIYYDQLGCGYSDRPQEPFAYSLERSVAEVELVRQALHLDKENFYLYGHSWGAILAMEYALKYQSHLKGLILSNMVSSAKAYDDYAENIVAKKLPPAAMDTIRQLSAHHEYGEAYFGMLFKYYFPQFMCRLPLPQWPEPLLRGFRGLNNHFANAIIGPDQFHFTGELEHWDAASRLPQLTVPTLTIGAQYDFMDPAHVKWMAGQVKHGSYLYCPNGSHCSFYDDQQVYMNGVIRFIKGVSAGAQQVKL